VDGRVLPAHDVVEFAEDRGIDSPQTMHTLLAGLGCRRTGSSKKAVSDTNKLQLRRQTEAAAEKGIFGAPTFLAGDEMFWGNDRLDDALAFCRATGSSAA
jgi:2-hydroxychromene-2-carboxylate isomerase